LAQPRLAKGDFLLVRTQIGMFFLAALLIACGSSTATAESGIPNTIPAHGESAQDDPSDGALHEPEIREGESGMESPPTQASKGAHEWAPFEVGRSWTYVFARDRSRTISGQEPEIERLRGVRIDEITADAPQFGQGVVRMQSSMLGRLDADPDGAEVRENSVNFYRSTGNRYQLVAEEGETAGSGSNQITHYASPLRLLESQAEVGQKWKVGTRNQGGLTTELTGEILGVQDVQTPAGLFERCLVVRIEGRIAGVLEAYGSRMEVPEGTFSMTEWFAPGVGLVLTKEELSQVIVLEDGSRLDYSERTQFALRSSEESAPASPPPSGAADGATR